MKPLNIISILVLLLICTWFLKYYFSPEQRTDRQKATWNRRVSEYYIINRR